MFYKVFYNDKLPYNDIAHLVLFITVFWIFFYGFFGVWLREPHPQYQNQPLIRALKFSLSFFITVFWNLA